MGGSKDSAREAAVHVVRTLRAGGHVAYLAGGCVRDALLGITPKDYDVATDAPPDRVRALFRRSRYVGEAFGVCLVIVGEHPIEVATFRSEWGYRDGRRPDHVIFTDAQHDARRRDFTINGLFEDPLENAGGDSGGIIDHVGGVADLRAGVVRAIGDAGARFGEDYLRMLRAVRFAARLGFEIEPATAAAIREKAPRLGQISRERIGAEVQAMLAGDCADPHLAATLMQTLRLDAAVLDEDHHDGALAVMAALTTGGEASLPGEAGHATLLAAWMIDRHAGPATLAGVASFVRGKAAGVIARWRWGLCLSNADREALRGVLEGVAKATGWPRMGIAGRKRLLASALWPQAARLLAAVDAAALGVIERDAAPLVAQGVAPARLIAGDDLIAAGMEPGPAFGPLLEAVYDAQLEGRVTTRDEALVWARGWGSGVGE